MKPIQLRKNTIDIPFINVDGTEAFTLHFEKTDENIKRIQNTEKELKILAKEIEGKEEADLEDAKGFLKKTIDSILGDGSFQQLYDANPFVATVTVYFYQIALGIKEELEKEDLQAAESKYLK
ncbi:hypothetical protein [Enterococcus faecalis]|uniref:hypothetical protein n=1 Tax=Enterococcus faecalis TaxID=1351 RepID=UPI003D0DC791